MLRSLLPFEWRKLRVHRSGQSTVNGHVFPIEMHYLVRSASIQMRRTHFDLLLSEWKHRIAEPFRQYRCKGIETMDLEIRAGVYLLPKETEKAQ